MKPIFRPVFRIFWGAILLISPSLAFGIQGVYLGGQAGQVLLQGNAGASFANAIGGGIDLGVRTNGLLDVVASFQASSHSGQSGLSLFSQTVSADFTVFSMNDFELQLGAGPGFYFFKTNTTDMKFGVHAEANADVKISDGVKAGIGYRWHGIFNSGPTSGNYATIMARVGYLFDVN